MSPTTLEEAKQLADHLDPLDQVRLIQYLVSRLGSAVADTHAAAPASSGEQSDAWEEFLRLGEELARRDRPEQSTLTESLLASRR
jgi:hypothetical protein